MKCEVVKLVKYYADGFTLSQHLPGEVADLPEKYYNHFLAIGCVNPIGGREVKPLTIEAPIEVKNYKRARKRADNAD